MRKKIHEDAWHLDDEHIAVLAAIASAKKVSIRQVADAGIKVDQALFDRLVSLELVKMTDGEACKPTETGRNLLWHRRWTYTGHPMFSHHPVVRWALNLEGIFGCIETARLEMDLGMAAEELEPHLVKMAEHSMIVRNGDEAKLLDRSRWAMDF